MPSKDESTAPDAIGGRQLNVLTRVGRNFGWLAGSTGFSAIASLVYVALTARALGPRGFGSFALVMTYGELVTNLAQFQSWKAVVGFGAAHQQANSRTRLGRLFGYTASLDLLSGIVGSAAAILGIVLIGPLLHWIASEESAAAWFGTVSLLTSGTTAGGILRLFNRFDLQVYSESLAQIVRLVGCLVGWAIGASVGWFLAVWALAALVLFVSQWAAVFARGHRISLGRRAFRLTGHENRGLWSFMLKTNVSSSLSLFWMQCGTLVVGVRAGPIEAGGFRLAHRFSLAMMKPVEIAAKALFPELARLVADGDHGAVRRVLKGVSFLSAVFASLMVVLAALFGRQVLYLVAGPAFEFAHQFLFLLCIAAAINVAGFALEPFLNGHFRPGIVLRSYGVAALLYGSVLIVLLPSVGSAAAAFASIAAAAVLMLQLGVASLGILRGPDNRHQDATGRRARAETEVAVSKSAVQT